VPEERILALDGNSLPSERNPEDPNRPETPSQATALTRRELRAAESAAAAAPKQVVSNALVKRAPVAPPARAAEPAQGGTRAPRSRPRLKRPTKKGAISTVVMTFAAALVVTMSLPAYAFGGGGSFDSTVASAEADLSGSQTLVVPDASAALAVSRDNYTAPTSAELAAAREAAAAAVAATEAAAAAAAAESTRSSTAGGAFAVNPPSGPYSGQAIVEFAKQFVGVVPYGSGASPDTSFGCDGLTQYVFGAFGIYLPRTVSNQAALGIPIAPEDAQAGDLIVWPIGHIGIYDGAGGTIDSPDWGRYVEHRPLWGSYYFVRIV
jgi:cell wall-associated NlpC family hydrolase